MRLHTAAARLLATGCLLFNGVAWSKTDTPSVKLTEFPFIPFNLNYFDDSNVVLFQDLIEPHATVYRSEDAGVSWTPLEQGKGKVLELTMHPFDNTRAYIITTETTHWKTSDRGKTWVEFHTEVLASEFREALGFSAVDPDRIIFHAMDCTGIFCEELVYYTTNGFEKEPNFLRSDTSGCHWGKSSKLFTTNDPDLDKNRILCVVKGKFSPFRKDYRLLVSDNFFQKSGGVIQEFEPELEPGRTVQGIVDLTVVKKHLIVAASADNTDEMALYVSDDTKKWHRAMFPHDHKLSEKAYTVLEGTNYSIQVDVLNSRPAAGMGVLFSSNSNGTYFTRLIEHTNRNSYGLVDFEKISGIQGIVLVNIAANGDEVESSGVQKKIKTQISFDDGRTWGPLKVEGEELHLHSVTDLSNSGRVFSSPAPGLVMGVGNTGANLGAYEDGNLYVSDDAGLTWRLALKGPHKYEFGDQGSILVVIGEGPEKVLQYSLNHGKDWQSVDLPASVRPIQLTTTADSTSLKFILEADDGKSPRQTGYLIALDFTDMHERQCKEDDMEKWYARVGKDGEPSCVMGHKQWFTRRKKDADCFINDEFHDPEAHFDKCECTDADFECDYNFVRSADKQSCIRAPNTKLALPEGVCKNFDLETEFDGPSGWRKIPGNQCEKGEEKDKPAKMKCVDAVGAPSSGAIQSTQNPFKGDNFKNMVYLERSGISSGDDETVLVRTEMGVFLSNNHGKEWTHILSDEAITGIYQHPYFNDMVFFLTPTKKVFYSTERGKEIRSFNAPDPPNQEGHAVMSFHPLNRDWIIWIGARDCDSRDTCHSVASITTDRGDNPWTTMQRYVRKCEFIKEVETGYAIPPSKEEKRKREKLVYCDRRKRETNDPTDNPWQLVSSDDFFVEGLDTVVHFENVVDFATMSEFIVVATKDEGKQTLKADASVDGKNFAPAQFPHGFNVDHQQGYTVLDSSTHSVFLHVTVNNERGLEYGSIIKSNSNGTFFAMSLNAVDRDTSGYVDFEKMFGIEGVAMANVVANYESKNYKAEGKKLKTMITHNDGAQWSYIRPPQGGIPNCKNPKLESCSLNIHGYTERLDKSHTYSSASAIGLMLGTGNVGEYLGDINKADTFMTADGGVTWKMAKEGSYMWEFGDQGSIVVLVKDREQTNVLHYTLDEGTTWKDYKFHDTEINVDDLTTVPSDNSRNFLLWGFDGDQLISINIDFSGLTSEQCKLNEDDVSGGDYDLWTPQHPSQEDDCLFGHVSQYHRKKKSANCYNGRMIPHLHNIAKNCSCTRRDFECDFNYEIQSDGSCNLVKGFQPPDHSAVCAQDDRIEYFAPTGYRRIPLSTCQAGSEMDISTPLKCPGKGDEFNKKYGPSAAGIFFAVTIPILAAAGVGYYVWKNWADNFGQIRLGEQSSFDADAPYIKYPVLVIAGVVAAIQATPLLVSSLWRSGMSLVNRGRNRRFTTRDSFARGRGEYAIVDEDEGELLGEDSDEEGA